MAVLNLNVDPIVPSDVFGYEPITDLGYARETFTITTAAKIEVGQVLVANYAAKTAVRVGALANAAAVASLGDLVIFVGRDLTNNPAVYQDFDRLAMTTTGAGVAITRGDGRGTPYKKHPKAGDVALYDRPAVVKAD